MKITALDKNDLGEIFSPGSHSSLHVCTCVYSFLLSHDDALLGHGVWQEWCNT